MVQWLGLHTSTAGGSGLIPGQGTKILQGTQHCQKIESKQPKNKPSEGWPPLWRDKRNGSE